MCDLPCIFWNFCRQNVLPVLVVEMKQPWKCDHEPPNAAFLVNPTALPTQQTPDVSIHSASHHPRRVKTRPVGVVGLFFVCNSPLHKPLHVAFIVPFMKVLLPLLPRG